MQTLNTAMWQTAALCRLRVNHFIPNQGSAILLGQKSLPMCCNLREYTYKVRVALNGIRTVRTV